MSVIVLEVAEWTQTDTCLLVQEEALVTGDASVRKLVTSQAAVGASQAHFAWRGH